MKFLLSLALLLGRPIAAAEETIKWGVLDTKLPKPLSDLTATKSTLTNKIYIAGGCDHEDGNVFNATGYNDFACTSTSSSLYVFDPTASTIETLEDMPRPRYRHAAVMDKSERLWLLGGRNVETDDILKEVDIYDTETKTWTTVGPFELATSDLGAFSLEGEVFVVGGYPADYSVASTNFLQLTLDDTSTTDLLVVVEKAPLLEGRGDVSVASNGLDVGYVSGGFTPANEWCSPLDTVEQYNLEDDTWEALPSLQSARADKGLVVLNGRLFAVGGEAQFDGKCDSNVTVVPGEQTIAVDDVEVLEDGSGQWKVLTSLPRHRFRFAAVAVDEKDTIYTFGGQFAYEASCQCFKTSDDIIAYIDEMDGATSAAGVVGAVATLVVAFVQAVIMSLV